jgi:hypothetical protein
MFSKVRERINIEGWPASFFFFHPPHSGSGFQFRRSLALLAILAIFSVRMFSTVSALLAARWHLTSSLL